MNRIEAAALAWHAAHVEARRLLADQNAINCDRGSGYGDVIPCFKDYRIMDGDTGETDRPPVSEWCLSCRRREAIHLAYRAATKARGIANRRLQALCRGAVARSTP